MTELVTLVRLRAVDRRLLSLVEPLDDADYRTQYHPDLSPIGWHLGHCAFIENYWLLERVCGDDRLTHDKHGFYFPENIPKPQRGPGLPPKATLMQEVERQQEQNILRFSGIGYTLPAHELLAEDYLAKFLLQHNSQHYETMNMVLAQRAMRRHGYEFFPDRRLEPAPPHHERFVVPTGAYPMGGTRPDSYDNELPRVDVHLPRTEIASTPVSNAQYLGFMQAGGYEDASLWSDEGWEWHCNHEITHPEHWRRDARGWWYGIDVQGPHELAPGEPVHGLSHYEAEAYARWAGARLPHEAEWEVACWQHGLANTGHVWEWCANLFYPYPGFEAFPYDGYSVPWFDGQHYVLRGASRHTRPDVRRPSFRNYYNPDKRHIFAGLRLAYGQMPDADGLNN
ncbi:MAG: SUMF1/EgtB/PvdO family nonheme iron enzyme [Gammaproteobacteria bacterium]